MYTPELAAAVCERLAKGDSLRAICREEGMPSRPTVHKWIIDDTEGFAAQYARARDVGLDELADELVEIADTPVEGVKTVTKPTGPEEQRGDMIEHRRLRVDARKWYLSKLAPKRYGERLQTEISGPEGGAIKLEDGATASKLASILAAAQERKDNTELA